mgnify:CR=1 FL=1
MRPKICVALPTSKHLHRQMIEGIVDFANANGPWQLFLVTEDNPRSGLRLSVRVQREGEELYLLKHPLQCRASLH